GFDTAAKTYAELIGNLTTDASSGAGVWHIVKVMGRTASQLVLEAALQTRPNLVYIGEEVQEQTKCLNHIVAEMTDLILERSSLGKHYGIVLIPEGLISFIPEIECLTDRLSTIIGDPEVLVMGLEAKMDVMEKELKS